MKLEQTIAIVTGSSSGVGAATARQIAAAGGKVVVNYVSKDQAAELVAEECRALGGEAVVCKGDVRMTLPPAIGPDCYRALWWLELPHQ